MTVPRPPRRPLVLTDVECYRNYFLIGFRERGEPRRRFYLERFEWNGQVVTDIDRNALQYYLSVYTIGTFNGRTYDAPMIAAALAGYNCENLKYLSDAIIKNNLKPWDVEKSFGIYVPPFVDHIDIIDVAPTQASLKAYGGKMHSKTIQDLPIEPDAIIEPHQVPIIRDYNGNDNDTSGDLFDTFEEQIQLREKMGARYGIDLRSKSDAQIAEAVFKAKIGTYVDRPAWAVGTHFNYNPPPFLQYQTDSLRALFETVKRAKFFLGPNAVELPPELNHEITPAANIRIGQSVYRIGIGGLHSSEACIYHLADADNLISDHDVTGYYPEIMKLLQMYPSQIGPLFQTILRENVDERTAAKKSGDKDTANSLKIVNNGTFGKTLSKYGILSAPILGIHTTITGQLSILMLIESLEIAGIPVISANTDGIVLKCPRRLVTLRDHIVKAWEVATGLSMEMTEYLAVFSSSVNDYIAIKTDRTAKLKGMFAPPIPVASSWPNPHGEICTTAIIEYLVNGTPLETTIRACSDIRKFVYTITVRGGGEWLDKPRTQAAKTKRGMREQLAAAGWVEISKELFQHGPTAPLPMDEAADIAVKQIDFERNIKREYLGRVARWYYAAGSEGVVVYIGSGNKVPDSDGSRACMTLPDTLPADIDYPRYVAEAKKMMASFNLRLT